MGSPGGFLGRAGEWLRHPIVLEELKARRFGRWAAGIALVNLLYLLAFVTVRLGPDPGGREDGPVMSAAFDLLPWLLAGGFLLSLCAHWLVPPFLLSVLCQRYELRTLILLVQGRREEDILRGQVTAGLVPLAIGAAPLTLVAPLLALWGNGHLPHVLAALGAAALWGGLCACVSAWSSSRWGRPLTAGIRTYGLTCLVLPLLCGVVAAGLGWGCSMERPDAERVFYLSGGLTWAILVVGSAAAFWDAAFHRLFPERRRPLWAEPPPAPRLEP